MNALQEKTVAHLLSGASFGELALMQVRHVLDVNRPVLLSSLDGLMLVPDMLLLESWLCVVHVLAEVA